jgi:tetratricopeptide (TPR) repeat protein
VDAALNHYLWLYARHQGKKEYALKLARLWSQKGNHAEAAAVLAPLMKDNPELDIQRWYALEVLLTGDFNKALKVYRKAWEEGDTHKETIINLARLYGRKQQFAKSASMWEEAGRRQLTQGELRWEAALAYSYARRYQDAVTILKPVERDNPNYPRIQVFLGQLHFYQKHWSQAAHYFQAYLEKHPEDLEVRKLLAEALAFKPQTRKEAIEEYGELLKRNADPRVLLRRVALLLDAQRWEEARQELEQCPPPQEPQLLKEQARLFLWLGELDEALKRYDDYLKREPRDGEASLEKARVLTFLGRGPEALKVLGNLRGTLSAVGLQRPERRHLLVASIEAALANKDWREASQWALRLYSCQFSKKSRPAKDWREARLWTEEERLQRSGRPGKFRLAKASSRNNKEGNQEKLTLEERTWVARALCHTSTPECYILAANLMVQNLYKNRYHHASLIILRNVPRFRGVSKPQTAQKSGRTFSVGRPGHRVGRRPNRHGVLPPGAEVQT